MNYQDTWLNGKLVERGYRPCEERYQVIAGFCKAHASDGLTVCDIGANMAYFSIRLIEDFRATALAFEFHQFPRRAAIVKKQRTDRLMYVNRKISLTDLDIMSGVMKFDLVLGLSVLHHVKDETEKWIAGMRTLSRLTIVEMALSDSNRTARAGYGIPQGGEVIGYGDSHLEVGFKRPIIAFINY